MIRLLILGAALALGVPTAAPAADLTVRVHGLRSDEGTVHVAIYDRPETFPRSKGMVREVVVPISRGTVETTFDGLQPGAYALALFHDENGNDKFDQGIFGVPLEGYAFSAGARAFLGPPSFDDARVTVPPEGACIDIRMGY